MGNSRRSFSDEFKREAVRRVALGEHPLSHVARELGIHPSLLQTWRRKLSGTDSGQRAPVGSVDLEAENRRLRRENANLREDREILKKAQRSLPRNPDEIRFHCGRRDKVNPLPPG